MRKFTAGLLAAGLGAATLAVPLAPVGAGVGDPVLNPGSTTITFQALSINIAGQELGLPKPTDPPQCSNGTNDDIALDDPDNPAAAQDLLIDFAGGDPECSDPLDNSEVMPGFQPKNDIIITGDVDANGVVELTSSDFPPLYVWVFAGAGFPLRLDFSADVSGLEEGTLDPATGAVDVDLPLQLQLYTDQGGGLEPPNGFLTCDTGVFPVAPSSDPSSPVNQGGVRPVSNFPYNTADGFVGVSDNTFAIPVLTAAFPDPGIEFFCNELNASFGLPSAPGNNATSIQLEVMNTDAAPTPFFSGGNASMVGDLTGTVTNGGAPAAGFYVGLYSDTSTGQIATAITDANGDYSFTGINAGRYRVRAYDPAGSVPWEWYQGSASYFVAGTVNVLQGGAAFGVDFGLGETGSVDGTVTDSVTTNPVAGATVNLYVGSGQIATTTTDGSGQYSFPDLAAGGPYYVRVSDPSYGPQWFGGSSTFNGANSLTVISGGSALGDVALDPSTSLFQVNGTVFDSDGTTPMAGVNVWLYTSAGTQRITTTNATGDYAFGNLDPSATWYVRAFGNGFTSEWYDNAPTYFTSTAIPGVGGGSSTADFVNGP